MKKVEKRLSFQSHVSVIVVDIVRCGGTPNYVWVALYVYMRESIWFEVSHKPQKLRFLRIKMHWSPWSSQAVILRKRMFERNSKTMFTNLWV